MSKESAEEKLLKMMQKTAPSVAGKSSAGASQKKKFKFSLSINALNAVLFLVIILCMAWLFAYEIPSGFSLLNQAVHFPTELKSDADTSSISLPTLPTVDYYLQKVDERNIFKPYAPKVVSKMGPQGLAAAMARYKLVGIAWLDMPDTASVMIQDTQDNKTYFLKAGEQLGGVTVKTIYTDRAVFSHENEETTIKL